MTSPHSTATQPNNRTRADVAAERYQERQVRRQPGPWAKVKPWAVAGLLGLALGAGVTTAAVYGQPPLPGAVQAHNAVVVLPDGSQAFMVSGWIVALPKALGQP